ncbi:MAG: CAP domain-containing protein [Kofleriaceae bacterium]
MRWAFGIAAVVCTACYDPAPPGGALCGPNETCPAGQECIAGRCDDGSCTGGDGFCRLECLTEDPDCLSPRCGDGFCAGNAGELCTTCAADCNTMSRVCGNGACETDEAPYCYADCGPSPWPWGDEEAAMIARINARRVVARPCPGEVMRPAAIALVAEARFTPPAREWSWELAHHEYEGSGACNGRTGTARTVGAGATLGIPAYGFDTIDDVADALFELEDYCPLVLDPTRRRIGVGVARSARTSVVILLD